MINILQKNIDQVGIINCTTILIIIQLILASFEMLALRRLYRPGFMHDWQFTRLSRSLSKSQQVFGFLLNHLFSYTGTLGLILTRLLLCVAILVLAISGRSFVFLSIPIAVLSLLLAIRNIHSNNGSDQLVNILLVAVSIAQINPRTHPAIRTMSIIFIAYQSQLSYLTSGFYKLIAAKWRNGRHLNDVLSTEAFGNRRLIQLMDPFPASYAIASFFITYGELLLGVSCLFPPMICLSILMCGLIFHLSVAFIMGFNTFIWAFLATYPAIYFISLHHPLRYIL